MRPPQLHAGAFATALACAPPASPARASSAQAAGTKLRTLKAAVEAAYRAGRARLSPQAASELESDRRAWRAWLPKVCLATLHKDRAALSDCRSRLYTDQLATFQDGFTESGGLRFFPRLRVLTAPDATPPSYASANPGFGEGRFSWPEIANPTPVQAA